MSKSIKPSWTDNFDTLTWAQQERVARDEMWASIPPGEYSGYDYFNIRLVEGETLEEFCKVNKYPMKDMSFHLESYSGGASCFVVKIRVPKPSHYEDRLALAKSNYRIWKRNAAEVEAEKKVAQARKLLKSTGYTVVKKN